MTKLLRAFLLITVLLAASVLPVSAKGHKVTICHKGRTISVSAKALDAHLDHGDWVVTETATCP